MHTAQSQVVMKKGPEAQANFNKTIDLATAKAKAATDPERKQKLEELVRDAEEARTKLGLVGRGG